MDATTTQKYVVGYIGSITNYTDALRICNKHTSSSVAVSIQFAGLVVDGGYADYIKQFVVYDTATGKWVGFTYKGQIVEDPVQIAVLEPGECVTLGASVLVSGDLPSMPAGYLAIYQVNIITSQ